MHFSTSSLLMPNFIKPMPSPDSMIKLSISKLLYNFSCQIPETDFKIISSRFHSSDIIHRKRHPIFYYNKHIFQVIRDCISAFGPCFYILLQIISCRDKKIHIFPSPLSLVMLIFISMQYSPTACFWQNNI